MREAGHDEETVRHCTDESWIWRNIFVADTDEEAERLGVPAFQAQSEHRAKMRKRTLAEQGLQMLKESKPPARTQTEHALICGSPATVAEKVAEIDKIDVGGLIMSFRMGPMPYDVATHSLRLFMEQVAPEFEARVAA
jgi:alkanesulfonate monooxygenase SsuD/methylene tetrahydromethanopterin reductase-like flavin-dependent oxidoreductase (luciferase family)